MSLSERVHNVKISASYINALHGTFIAKNDRRQCIGRYVSCMSTSIPSQLDIYSVGLCTKFL